MDLGYPTGEQLVENMRNFLSVNPEQRLKGGFAEAYRLRDVYPNLSSQLERVSIANIDTFVRDNPSLEHDAKTMIAYVLLQSELPIYADMACWYKKTRKDQYSSWLLYLFSAITSQCSGVNDVLESLSNLTVITFNYDVSFEAFFLNQFQSQERYQSSVQTLLDGLDVIHIYGRLYDLKDQNGYDLKRYACYQTEAYNRSTAEELEDLNFHYLHKAKEFAKNINVMAENKQQDAAEQPHILKARQKLKEAEAVQVIGFGFDPDNLKLLQDKEIRWGYKKQITYTNFGSAKNLRARAESFFEDSLSVNLNELPSSAYVAAKSDIIW